MACGGVFCQAQGSVEDTLSTLEQWVETERRIADEKSEWETEKDNLLDLLALYKEELRVLDESIEAAAADVSAAETKRAEITEMGERVGQIEAQVEDAIVRAEIGLKALAVRLPKPLLQEISPVFNQLPKNPRDTKLSIGQRIQFVVAVLTQIQKFNSAVTVTEEFREFSDGKQVQIDAVYFGLGAAYYVDKANQHAGFGRLAESGWEWQDDDGLVSRVRQTIEIYGAPGKAAFVELPVEIR